ncbi:TMEM175 family protein [Streptomyces beijiangensis]|uniref:TMEM175 family protein n=1 Tax=Streptomyces beijiangensis TaxID=163361 RepID=UPI0027DC1444|nr:TMEM175 family protein [Streptomyces beijiangensis]
MTNESGRLEAFSDGVFAIAITLLILEIKVPEHAGGELWKALGEQWPSYAAYVVSFLVIGIMWLNHHQIFRFVARVDRTLMFLNLLLLMTVAALPWPAALLATYLREGSASHVAAAVYSGLMVVMALTFQAVWWHLTKTGHLFDDRVDALAARATLPQALNFVRAGRGPIPLCLGHPGLPGHARPVLRLRAGDPRGARAARRLLRLQSAAGTDEREGSRSPVASRVWMITEWWMSGTYGWPTGAGATPWARRSYCCTG